MEKIDAKERKGKERKRKERRGGEGGREQFVGAKKSLEGQGG